MPSKRHRTVIAAIAVVAMGSALGATAMAGGSTTRLVPMAVMTGLNGPQGITVNVAGNLYVADNNANEVLELTHQGHVVTVGSGFSHPSGVAANKKGDVWVADTGHNRVVEVNHFGVMTTVATGFSLPTGVAVDASGDVFVADTFGNRIVEVTPSGSQRTVGTGFHFPQGVAVQPNGNVYVADSGNHRVVEVTPTGTQRTVATGVTDFSVAVTAAGTVFTFDDTTSSNAIVEISPNGHEHILGPTYNVPYGIAVGPSGNLFVSDSSNNEVFKLLR